MESAIHSEQPARRPFPSLFIGIILLLYGSGALLLRLLAGEPATGVGISTQPTVPALVLTVLCGLYLLACLHRNANWRKRQQRLSGGAILTLSAALLYPALTGSPLSGGIESPAIDTLSAFLIAGCAGLFNPSVRTLTQLAATFLLILLFATLAITGITNHVLDYEPFFAWRNVRHMSPEIAVGLLLFAFGLSYTSWWCHRQRVFDPVGGITLIASILLIFSALVGAGLISAVAASYLHVEIRNDLTTLINERSARIVTLLRHGQELSQLLREEAQHAAANALSHRTSTDYALRIIDAQGRVLAARNGDWFKQKTFSAISRQQTTLWRGETGHCQLRTWQKFDDRLIETSVPLDLTPILNARKDNHDTEDLTLCAYLPDGTLRCLAHSDMMQPEIPAPLAADSSGRFRSGGSTLLYGNGAIQAIMPIPEFGLVAYMEKSNQEIFGPFYQKLYLVLPLAMLLLAASVGLIAWRLHPLAKQLHRSEQRYRSLVDGAADAIVLHDENRRFLETNAAASAMLGYSRNELVGMHPDDFLLEKDKADAREQMNRLNNGGTMINSRRQLRRKDGSLATVEINATRLDSGMMISVVRDISEQIKTEAALREKERFIRSVIEVLAEGVVVHQADGTVVYCNRAATQILGSDLANSTESITDARWSLIHDDHTPFEPDAHPVMLALTSGLSQRNVIMGLIHPDGNRIWLSVNSEPLIDEHSYAIIGAVVSFSDITEKRSTERALHLKRERLRALSSHLIHVREEEKSSIAREIHDELGSSLTAIKMGIEWIDEKMSTRSPELQQRLEQVTEVTTHAIQATRRLVTQLRPSVLEDLGLWAALEWQIREFSKHSSVFCTQNLLCNHIHLPPQIALVVYRVVQEALNNIAKHAQASAVRIECWLSDGQLTITLEDNGIGIDEEVTHSITSYGIRGMYERIIQINGQLQILGTPGEGTLVVLTIPYHETTEAMPND